MALMTKLT
jgi:hypothetical protein